MTIGAWTQVILFGGMLGAIGQAIRVIVGLKKLNDQSDASGKSFKELIVPSVMVTSLLIGFVAGTLAAISLGLVLGADYDKKTVLALIAAGYSGADFIEGIISSYLPSRDPGGVMAPPGGRPSGAGAAAAERMIADRAARLPAVP
ncbi:MAG: hypothetical protein HOP28_15870 [Gemmatimonadales bacterium]|nr:hypothetical protein [Gemmatimonadales bacterium]